MRARASFSLIVRSARTLSASLFFLLTSRPNAALATTCAEVCGSSTGDCHISTLRTVSPGSVLDCSGRDVFIDGPHGRIEVTNGIVTLLADDLSVAMDRYIEAQRTSGTAAYGIDLQLSGGLTLVGYLRATEDGGGGAISVHAAGNIQVLEAGVRGILASGTAPDAAGGKITLVSGGNVVIEDKVLAEGAGLGVTDGGTIEIEATGDITIDEHMSVSGSEARGGDIRLTAGDTVLVNDWLKAEGAGRDGDGGLIEIIGARVETTALLSAQGGVGTGGGLSGGGGVHLEAGTLGMLINGDIDVTAGEEGPGSVLESAIVATSAGDLTVGTGVELLSKSDGNGGDGGDIEFEAAKKLSLAGDVTLDARGHAADGGAGARVRLTACEVSISTGSNIDASGAQGGRIHISGRKRLELAGVMNAGGTSFDGENELRYRTVGTCSNDPAKQCNTNADCTVGCQTGTCIGSSIVGQATYDPAPVLVHDPAQPACP